MGKLDQRAFDFLAGDQDVLFPQRDSCFTLGKGRVPLLDFPDKCGDFIGWGAKEGAFQRSDVALVSLSFWHATQASGHDSSQAGQEKQRHQDGQGQPAHLAQ